MFVKARQMCYNDNKERDGRVRLMKLLIASNNAGKVREFRELLSGKFEEICSMSEAGVHLEVEETGSTFLENAEKKAREICAATQTAAIADDSGLCVEALGGAPGVYSARYAGEHGNDEANIDLLLERLSGEENRRAKFVSAVVLCLPDGQIFRATGEVRGLILDRRVGKGGFGYDPVFYAEELGKSFGEATPEEKNSVSHRSRALAALLEML